jgi:hypothetical protein
MKIHEVYPYLCVSDTNAALDFYNRAFGAQEKFRLVEPSADTRVYAGRSDLTGSRSFPGSKARSPTTDFPPRARQTRVSRSTRSFAHGRLFAAPFLRGHQIHPK